jgi:SAM-dependent methyltransferase
MTERGISPEQAKRFYDRFGARQDRQGWFEDQAVARMVDWGDFGDAGEVFELGFGTGRLAETLFRSELTSRCRYTGMELSTTMFNLATARLEPWADRVRLFLVDGSSPGDTGLAGFATDGFDRFVATYVLDLMDRERILEVMEEAWRVLQAGGLFCITSLTCGHTPGTRLVSWLWSRIQAIAAERVGGCRPISPVTLLGSCPRAWNILHTGIVCRFGVCSEVVVARK